MLFIDEFLGKVLTTMFSIESAREKESKVKVDKMMSSEVVFLRF